MQQKKKQHKSTTLTGIITITRGGVGFVMHETLDDDIRIEHDLLNTALNGDTVEVLLLPKARRTDRQAGKVVRVIERARTTFVGTLTYTNKTWTLTPDNPRVYTQFVLPDGTGAKDGHKAVVELTTWSSREQQPHATLVELLGPKGEHETEIQAILRDRGFIGGFLPAIENAARALKDTDTLTREELTWREDFRDTLTFTIDPVDAKDFDDALSFKVLANGNYEVGVHIADVTHYVRPGDILDTEARERATSVYLVDRTIPMLPEVLSNDLCSLNPNEDKRAFAAIFEMSPEGVVANSRFAKTLIRSDHRFTYQTAQDVLDGNSDTHKEALDALWSMAQKLRSERVKKGAIEFESDEVQFVLDTNGTPIDVHVKERLDTMRLIEEWMLLANRTVAYYVASLSKGKNPLANVFIYRIHDAPDPDKLAELSIFLRALGYDHFNKEPHLIKAADIARLLRDVKGTPEEAVVNTTTLRSMAKAIYSDKNIGHFSLGFTHYTHFTSPIRRYPDMLVHRVLFAHLSKQPIAEKELKAYRALAITSSQREVEAVRAERDSVKFKQVEYMHSRVGETFAGTITGISRGGMFVAEDITKAEGMVRLSALPGDWYDVDERHYRIVGQKTKKVYRVGDTVTIKLIGANLETRELDWEVVV